ncbi:arsenite transporter [Coprinopsis cinerea okayama7|uniref:Arsenite transporter n=1 Tax=Coprinopsis cinerea (strain Okayama-7 / 130 / ATCC MYA-4618 / FGSC 9003) TaxID=240176 RepID=A8N6H9_COPC7|nr:arsenite transporter [Coprinopsis cinerea okayama7\|eukprot:XP_001830436.2 arsenite transporter [Coprinopsis cinerea okayama7\
MSSYPSLPSEKVLVTPEVHHGMEPDDEGLKDSPRASSLQFKGKYCMASSRYPIFSELSIFDKLLTPLIIVTMVVGVVLGEYVPSIKDGLDAAKFHNVSLRMYPPSSMISPRLTRHVAIAIGLIVMMWPILTKVQYERLPALFKSKQLWIHIGISLAINWTVGPFLMLGLAWATLPDLPTYRTGVIMVGIARCIAMVMIWNDLARGDADYAAILVVVNAVLQIILYSPLSLLFINVIGNTDDGRLHLDYGNVAISVLIYLGIPLAAGIVTRFVVWKLTSKEFFEKKFLPFFGPLALLGLLYTILVLFAYQGQNIVANVRPVFRVFVPLIVYFVLMWFLTFFFVFYLSKNKDQKKRSMFTYEMATVQAFTAASNNFELAIAVAIAVYGVNSEQALAATIGPLIEVPVLLALTWVSLYLRHKLNWPTVANVTLNDKN